MAPFLQRGFLFFEQQNAPTRGSPKKICDLIDFVRVVRPRATISWTFTAICCWRIARPSSGWGVIERELSRGELI